MNLYSVFVTGIVVKRKLKWKGSFVPSRTRVDRTDICLHYLMKHTGEFTKRVMEMSTQLIVRRGIDR